MRELFLMLTEHSAKPLNLNNYGLAVGNPAALVGIDAASAEQAPRRNPYALWRCGNAADAPSLASRQPPELHTPY